MIPKFLMNYIIGIDIGTTNTKAVAYDMEGHALHQCNKSYPFISEQEGYHELDPDVLFAAFIEVLKEAVSQTTSYELCGVSFSAAMHGLMAVDEKGLPLTNMITWADLRSNQYAVDLKNSEIGKKIYERTGTPVHPMSPLCKLMWMKDHIPGIFISAHKFISIKEYIFFHLYGEFIIDRSIASSTGLLDIYSRDWNADALQVAGITAERLSKPIDATFILRGLKSSINGVPDVPFVIGASDGCLAHLGSNAMHEGDISLTIGTSGAVRIRTDKPVHDPKQRIFNYLLTDNFYLSGGPVNNGGNVLQWFAKGFLEEDFTSPENFESFIVEAFAIPPGSEGLIFLPYIYGERAPVWDASAKGIFMVFLPSIPGRIS